MVKCKSCKAWVKRVVHRTKGVYPAHRPGERRDQSGKGKAVNVLEGFLWIGLPLYVLGQAVVVYFVARGLYRSTSPDDQNETMTIGLFAALVWPAFVAFALVALALYAIYRPVFLLARKHEEGA